MATSRPYGLALQSLLSGEISWLGHDIKVALLTSGYVPNEDVDRYLRVPVWVTATAYALGDVRRPTTSNGHVYRVTTAGTSGAAEPVWPTAAGSTVVDGTVTWTEDGTRDALHYEAVGTGYTAGGQSLTSKTSVYDPATNTLTLDAADPTWAASTITARWAIFYRATGDPLTSPLLCRWDFGADVSSAADAFTLTLHTSGLLTAKAP